MEELITCFENVNIVREGYPSAKSISLKIGWDKSKVNSVLYTCNKLGLFEKTGHNEWRKTLEFAENLQLIRDILDKLPATARQIAASLKREKSLINKILYSGVLNIVNDSLTWKKI